MLARGLLLLLLFVPSFCFVKKIKIKIKRTRLGEYQQRDYQVQYKQCRRRRPWVTTSRHDSLEVLRLARRAWENATSPRLPLLRARFGDDNPWKVVLAAPLPQASKRVEGGGGRGAGLDDQLTIMIRSLYLCTEHRVGVCLGRTERTNRTLFFLLINTPTTPQATELVFLTLPARNTTLSYSLCHSLNVHRTKTDTVNSMGSMGVGSTTSHSTLVTPRRPGQANVADRR